MQIFEELWVARVKKLINKNSSPWTWSKKLTKTLPINSSTSETFGSLVEHDSYLLRWAVYPKKQCSSQFDLHSNLHFFSRIITCFFAHLNFFVYTHSIQTHSTATARRTSSPSFIFLFDHISLKREITQGSKKSGIQTRIHLN